MANTIFLTSASTYDGRRLELSCSQEMNTTTNTSIIKWTLTSVGGGAAATYAYSTGPTTVSINGVKVYYEPRVSYTEKRFPATKGSISGQLEVKHNADGTKAIPVSLSTAIYFADVKTASSSWTLDAIPKGATIVAAPNFTDEENPTIRYSVPNGNITSLQACISLTGGNPDIPYRDIDVNGEYYTFELTQEEKDILYAATNEGKTSRTVYFYLRTIIDGEIYFKNSGPKTFTVVDCEPEMEVSFEEADTLVLMGGYQDGEEYPAYFYDVSDIAYTITPTLKKGATLKECFFGIGAINDKGTYIDGKYGTTLSGVIKNIQDNYYEAFIIDSRGQRVDLFDRFPMVPYNNPTVELEANLEVFEETYALATLQVSGEIYRGSLGNSDNFFQVDYRYRANGGEWSNWKVGGTAADATFGYDDENFVDTYSLTIMNDTLNYLDSYEFQVRVIDSLNTLESHVSKVFSIHPVFDWSRTDFNFNVPLTIQGSPLADYVIETGTDSMGSNGTWYWSKWKSGKAECYGIRNFGNMGVSTAWGSSFESPKFEQDLPSGLFAAHPTVMIGVEQSSLGCWIERAPGTEQSADSTGGFYVCRAKSNNLSAVHISFQCVGRWK